MTLVPSVLVYSAVRTLRGLHSVVAWVVIVANGAAAFWALLAHRVDALRRPWLWWFTAAAQCTVVVQVVLGVALVSASGGEAPRLHSFYGFLTFVAVTMLFAYRGPLRHRIHLLYGFGGLFVMGLALRALLLDPI